MVVVPASRLVVWLLAALALTAILAAPARILAESDRASPARADRSVAAADQGTRNPAQTGDADHPRASSSKPAASTADKDGRAFAFGLLIVELVAHAPSARFK